MASDFSGKIKQKLIDSKQKWAETGRLLTGRPDGGYTRRLPPGQHLVRDWPVLDLGITPHIEPPKFKLAIDGEVENPITLDFDQFLGLPAFSTKNDIHCVTSWSRYDNHWDGVASLTLADLVRPKPTARHVLFTSHDGYTTNVRIHQFLDDGVLLAHHWEGSPLSDEHGGPVRVIIPKLYLWKSAKWIRQITFLREDKPGFWENRGYHNNADPWTEQRYS